ncbi:MAG TPA: bifunctional oligoribonuclease/PAP phosphatase NrnA [Fimbriimonadaceae bacterium]|nr:bifunctional oligoribonuclease/PAP phosphatase NrnA [Fimbriimonadaceae bacterium]
MNIKDLLPAFLTEVQSAKGVLIGTHVNPDGDAIGAALAVSHALDQLEVEHEVLCADPPPYYLKFLPGAERIRQIPEGEGHSLGVILDLEAPKRLGSVRKYFEECDRTVVIDHHVPMEALGDLRIVVPGSPATCQILVDLFSEGPVKITPEMADCLLTGILTDTGSFRYPNTDAHSLHSAGMLLEHGAQLPRITQEVYMSKERPAIELTARAIVRMKTDCHGQIAWSTLPLEVIEEVGAQDQHTEGIVNELLSIQGVRIAMLLRESRPLKIKGSLRSVGDLDVAAVAHAFGGGGHVNAAGVTFDGSMEEAVDQLVAALKQCLESC